MMDSTSLLLFFHNRKSVREFTQEPIEDNILSDIIYCGLSAPSAMGRNAHFLKMYVRGEENYQKLKKLAFDKYGEDPFYDAPYILAVCEKENSLSPYLDGAAMAENILLAIANLDLGGCWIDAMREMKEENHKIFEEIGISENMKVVASIAFGHKKV